MKLKLKIAKKAWWVKDPTVWENDTPEENWELVYGDSSTQAKLIFMTHGEYTGYLSIKVKRSKANDRVIFEDRETKRHFVEERLKTREKIKAKTDAIMKFPDLSSFYVQHGYVGNCISFWGLGGCGYVTDISKAQKYTREQILKQFVSGGRDEDKIWLADEVEKKVVSTVDAQHVDYKFCISA